MAVLFTNNCALMPYLWVYTHVKCMHQQLILMDHVLFCVAHIESGNKKSYETNSFPAGGFLSRFKEEELVEETPRSMCIL
jgi:hypothetical protein